MAAIKLLDFQDIYSAVLEEIGEQTSNTNALNKVKRYVNVIYVDEVVPFKDWKWLRKRTDVIHKSAHNDGTCSVTPASTTVTLSTAPDVSLGSFAGYRFVVDGFAEIYTVDSHTAGSTTVTLNTDFQGTLNTAATYKIWRDRFDLPTDALRTFQVDHDRHMSRMRGVGLQELQKITKESPFAEGFPQYYHTDDFYDPTTGTAETESDRYRRVFLYPSIHTTENVTLHVDYIQEVSELDADGDEPLMPIGDRVVLFYGAVSWAWRQIARNPEEADRRYQDFLRKLERMSAELEDGFDMPAITIDPRYRTYQRRSRLGRRQGDFATSASSTSGANPNVTFAKDITIEGATFTDDATFNSGVDIILTGRTAGSVLFVGSSLEVQEDNSYFFWDDTNNRLGIGVAASENTVTIAGSSLGSTLSVHAEGSTDLAEFSVHRHTSTAAFGSHFVGVRSRGSEASETAVISGDNLMRIVALGHDGTDYAQSAAINFEVDATPGAGDMPGRIVFLTSPDGSETPAEAMRISADKDVLVRANFEISSSNPTINFYDVDASDGDINAAIDVNATDTGSGTEDADISIKQQIAGTLTEVALVDADGDWLMKKDLGISSAAPVINFYDTDATAGDVNASISAAATDTGDGSEDIDISFKQQVAGTLTETLLLDADGSAHFKVPVVIENELALQFYEASGNGTNYNEFKSPSALAGNVTYTWPTGAPSANGHALKAQTDGTMSWGATDTVSSTGNVDFNFIDEDTTDNDIGVVLRANATDTGSGTEDVDFSIHQQIAGALTEVVTINADGEIEFPVHGLRTHNNGSVIDVSYAIGSTGQVGLYRNGANLAAGTGGIQIFEGSSTTLTTGTAVRIKAGLTTQSATVVGIFGQHGTTTGWSLPSTANIYGICNGTTVTEHAAGAFSVYGGLPLRLNDSDNSNYIGIKAPSAVTSDVDYTLPEDGNAGDVMATDGSGVLSQVARNSKDRSAKVASYTITDTDGVDTIEMTTDTTDRTVTLPTLADNLGRVITVVKMDSASGYCLVDPEGSETIDGSATGIYLNEQWQSVTLLAATGSWLMIGKNLEESKYAETDSSTTSGATANTYEDVSGSSLVLEPGTWELGYQGSLRLDDTSGSQNDLSASVRIEDGSSGIEGSVSFCRDLAIPANLGISFPVCASTIVTITATTTFVLQIRCSEGSATGTVKWTGSDDGDGSLTNDDLDAKLWARRAGR